ncbi:MAG: GNAT family N-acetyltransferase [Steroidobacteraceae bacterium]
MAKPTTVDGIDVTVSGTIRRIARIRAEFYEYVSDPGRFLQQLGASGLRADVFTFLQDIADDARAFEFQMEHESIAVLRITTYEAWWKQQLNDKTRNMIRKAQKAGVGLSVVPYDDKLVRGIVDLYNENPLRQGKPFAHFGKDFDTIKRDHSSYLDTSDFIAAYHGDELIGFAKLVHRRGVSNLMQIISKISHRDKAPTNALIAKAVEICAARGVRYLHYGLWSKRGLGDFKRRHAFEQFNVRRYFVPLTLKGRLLLALRLHRKLADYVPERWEDRLVALRAKLNTMRYGAMSR